MLLEVLLEHLQINILHRKAELYRSVLRENSRINIFKSNQKVGLVKKIYIYLVFVAQLKIMKINKDFNVSRYTYIDHKPIK